MDMEKLGVYAFLACMAIAVIAGIAVPAASSNYGTVVAVLTVLGLVVGFLNVTEKEATPFLVASIALLSTSVANFTVIPTVGVYVQDILRYIAVFVAPGAVLVAVKAIWGLASGK